MRLQRALHDGHELPYWRSGLAWVLTLVGLAVCGGPQVAWASVATTTTLAVSSGSGSVTTVAAGSVVTLTATVNAGSAPVTPGQVNFCDAGAMLCTDIHLLGTAQLTAAGTATVRFIPGIGVHSYKAVFAGTGVDAASSSGAAELTVTGTAATSTTIAASGTVGDYTLTATVTGSNAGAASPTGMVSFLDTSNSNFVLGTATLGAGTTALSFVNSTPSPGTNPYPQSVAIGDFNGDGKMDMAVAVYSIFTPLSDISVFLGKGDGTFTPAGETMVTGQNAGSITAGDFNGDGKLDLAITLPDANQVQILLGNGDGTFSGGQAVSVNDPFFVATGDFNGDGIADLAVVNPGPDTVTILLGKGDGTFTAAGASPTTGGAPVALTVGDFNGDGKLDLAVANFYGDSVTILFGNGDGTFQQTAQNLPTGTEPESVVTGDFNGDGKLDLAVANAYIGSGMPGSVSVYLGKGDGTFTATGVSPATGSEPYGVAVGDFNGDGKADLVTSNIADNDVTVLLGNGDGSFAAGKSVAAGSDPLFVAVGDFNDDGLTDAAVVNNNVSTVTVLLSEVMHTATAVATGINPVGAGTHLVDASYPGDTSYSASLSGTVPLMGTIAPAFSLSGTAVILAAPGASGTSTITVTPSNGFTGNVALTCGLASGPANAIDLPTCTITTPVTIAGTAAGTATLTVNTTAVTKAAMEPVRGMFPVAATVAMSGMLLFVLPGRRRRWKALLGLLVFAAIAGVTTGCSTLSTPVTQPTGGTTVGSYSFTVIGTSGTLTASTVVGVTVN